MKAYGWLITDVARWRDLNGRELVKGGLQALKGSGGHQQREISWLSRTQERVRNRSATNRVVPHLSIFAFFTFFKKIFIYFYLVALVLVGTQEIFDLYCGRHDFFFLVVAM